MIGNERYRGRELPAEAYASFHACPQSLEGKYPEIYDFIVQNSGAFK